MRFARRLRDLFGAGVRILTATNAQGETIGTPPPGVPYITPELGARIQADMERAARRWSSR